MAKQAIFSLMNSLYFDFSFLMIKMIHNIGEFDKLSIKITRKDHELKE